MAEQPAWAAAAEAVGAGAVAWLARMFFRKARNVSDSESIRLFRRELMEIKREMRDTSQRLDIVTERVDTLDSSNEETMRQLAQLGRTMRSEWTGMRSHFNQLDQKMSDLLGRLPRD